MKLELKHLAPYLPYGLKFTTPMLVNPVTLAGFGTDTDGIDKLFIHHSVYTAWYPIENFKPLLLPLSEITKEDCKKFGYVDIDDFIHGIEKGFICYVVFEQLISNHFDVFGLIDVGLALNKLTHA